MMLCSAILAALQLLQSKADAILQLAALTKLAVDCCWTGASAGACCARWRTATGGASPTARSAPVPFCCQPSGTAARRTWLSSWTTLASPSFRKPPFPVRVYLLLPLPIRVNMLWTLFMLAISMQIANLLNAA